MSEQRGLEFGDVLRRDVGFAMRSLARRPLFTATVVLTLALGIGANTAMFSAVDTVLLRPLPVDGLDRLVTVYDDLPGINLQKAPMSPAEATDLFARTDLFEAATAFGDRGQSVTLTGFGEPRRVSVKPTMGRFFDLFSVRPHLGRLYGPEESQPGRAHVAVLGYDFWRDLTGGDPGLVGRTVDLNGSRYEVIGVLPPELRFPRGTEIWTPLEVTPRMLSPSQRTRLYMTFVGRLRPGVTPEQLADQLAAEAERWHRQHPGEYDSAHRHTLVSEPFVVTLAGQLRPVLLVLMGAVALVLLIACANVASLQLVRATGRIKELAVRTALGAARWSIVRQLLTESLLLAIAGGLLGLLFGACTIELLTRWNAVQFEALREVRLDPAVLAFTAAITLLSAVLFGLVPALRAARVDPQETLKESARGTSGGARQQRLLKASVVVQLALTLVLLLASGLTIRSLFRLLETDPGFRTEQVMTMTVGLPPSRYTDGTSRTLFFDSLLERLNAVPGIQAAGLVMGLPFGEGGDSSPFDIKGRPKQPGEPERHANIRVVSGDYFQALGIPLLRGVLLDESNAPPLRDASTPVSALIDEALAKKYFGSEDPVGRILNQGPDAVIVGVVGAVRDGELGKDAYPTVYYSQRQYNWIGTLSVAVRSTLEPETAVRLVRDAVRELDRGVPVFDVAPMRERVESSLGSRRLAMAVLTGFAALSLLLAVLGVYGVISYSVSQRTHEIGIRMALGARPADVIRMVLQTGAVLAALGAVAGTLVFLGLGRVLESLVYGVGPRDPMILGAGIALLGGVALFACYGPAQRAASIDPVEALRGE
ncbi:MAG TPA: ABC transporter permease [Thermoanaerobaculia bacterium]|nr:ABC transporter permease [Thermoanaerobaculia bacterium]